MEPLVVLFVLFSPLWWLLFLTASGLIIWALEEEKGVWATVTIVAAVILMTVFGTMPTVDWVQTHQYTLLFCGVGYFVAGALWGYAVKWYFYCTSKREKYEEKKRHWLRDRGRADSKNVPEDLKEDWEDAIKADPNFSYRTYTGEKIVEIKPRYWNHKARTLRWAVYWPWSFLWSVFDDVIRNVFRYLQRFFGGIMEWISNFVFRDLDADFKVKEEEIKK
jgi:hypothetical protein